MSEFELTAKEVIEKVGGMENIKTVNHCMTRLRLELKDRSLVNEEELKKVKFVKGLHDSSGQLHIIFGTGIVNKVYKEVNAIFSKSSRDEIKTTGGNSLQNISRFFGDIFIPIIPVIVACGVLMGVRTYLVSIHVLVANTPWYSITATLIDTGFTFLPVLVAWSATKKFGGSPVLGIVMGLMLLSSNLPAASAVGKGTAQALVVTILGIKFYIKGYQGSVLVAVLAGWLVSFIEEKVRKIVPNVVDMILTPILTLGITFFVILFGFGPIAQIIENGIVATFRFLFTLPYGIGGFIIGGLQQVLVITGLHHVLWIIDINFLAKTGLNLYMPVRNASVLGQAGACMAFAVFARDVKLKSNSIASTVSALFGITEPAIFGTTLIYGIPFLFGMLGSAVGGMFSTAVGLAAPGMGAAGIPGILYFIGGNLNLYLIQSFITIIIPFVLTSIYIKKKSI